MSRVPRLIESFPVMPIWTDGIACIEEKEGAICMVYYVRQPCYEAGGVIVRQIAARVILPYSQIMPGRVIVNEFLTRRCTQVVHVADSPTVPRGHH